MNDILNDLPNSISIVLYYNKEQDILKTPMWVLRGREAERYINALLLRLDGYRKRLGDTKWCEAVASIMRFYKLIDK